MSGRRRRFGLRGTAWAAAALLALVAACRPLPDPGPSGPSVVRFADLTAAGAAEATEPDPPQAVPWIAWRFGPAGENNRSESPGRWQAGPGVLELREEGDLLTGVSAGAAPLLYLRQTFTFDQPQLLEAIEIRLRVSAGTSMSIALLDQAPNDLASFAAEMGPLDWPLSTPLVPGGSIRTYRLQGPLPLGWNGIRQILLRPTDVANARFEIESIRPIFRPEKLAAIPVGWGWHGLGEIYRESLAARVPSSRDFRVTLPPRPRFEVALGTIDPSPMTFEVTITPNRGEGAPPVRRTVTTANRWELLEVDLDGMDNREVTVSLSVTGTRDGSLGLWGNPVVRGRPPSQPGTAPRGVIVIWTDSLRSDHLEAYGYGRTTAPTLARMAREGALFSDAVSQGSWTKVSTVSLLTSLYSTTHGVVDFSDRLPISATTLAEVFREAGYATLSMSSILLTGKFTNLHQGFDEVHESIAFPDSGSSKTARGYVDRLLPWLERHRDDPFFVLLHVYDPHDPYRPDPPYDTLWHSPRDLSDHEERSDRVADAIADPLLRRFGMPTREDLEEVGYDATAYVGVEQDLYDGSILAMDTEVARILERLHELGLDDSTLVVFTSDHGEEFLDHGRMFHGQGVYSELIQVPLVFWGPGTIPAGLVLEQTVELVDLMPTLLELSGLPIPEGVQGDSLVSLWNGGARSDGASAAVRPAFAEKAAVEELLSPPPRETEAFSLILGDWKLIHNTRRQPGVPEFELFDRRSDPGDRINLADERPELVERLATHLADWRRQALEERLDPESPTDEALSSEQLEQLRSLGYLGGQQQ